ncbi:uncharacterized protein [Hoplias malabaricus]|uniref:uncharacterized protein n=1 Tax=Hoplias malabaricus TaxID=27720 RepID=UPI0034620196
MKEGYQMFHDQYVEGNLSLTITDADFSKRARYTCDCESTDICDVNLQILPSYTPLHVRANEPLLLKLDIPDTVAVMFNSTAGPSSGQICSVDGRLLDCKPEYKKRTSLTSALELREVAPTDSGIYTVMDTLNTEPIHIYEVTIEGEPKPIHKLSRMPRSTQYDPLPCKEQNTLLMLVFGLFTVAIIILVLIIMVAYLNLKKENQTLRIQLASKEIKNLNSNSS